MGCEPRWRDCVFDLYGTLADIRTDERSPQLWQAMARWYAGRGADYAPEALAEAYFDAVRALEREAEAAAGGWPEIDIRQVFLDLFRRKGALADMDLAVRTGGFFRAQSLVFIRLYDGALALLRALRANGQRVWLLSNAQRIFTMPELERLGLAGCFDGIYLSSDAGFKKPDARFFQALLSERAIDPARAVMVGNDGACDIRGAQAVGLATVYVRSDISPQEPLPAADLALDRVDLGQVQAFLTQPK